MVCEVGLRRREFVREIKDTSISVDDAKAAPELSGIDVGAADANHDGVISGRREARLLFKDLDRKDTDPSPRKLRILEDGKLTPSGERVEALARLGKALGLKKLADNRISAAVAPDEGRQVKALLDTAAEKPSLEKVAHHAERMLARGDYEAFAKDMWTISKGSSELEKRAAVLAQQAEFCADVKAKAGACSFPPSEKELKAYFRTFRDTKDVTGATEAYKKYADRFYLDVYSDPEVPAEKQDVDILYSKKHYVAWQYRDKWSMKECPDKIPQFKLNAGEPLSWQQITADRELSDDGRRLVDCEAFAYMGGELLREALPEADWTRRYVAVKDPEYAGHAMAEFIPTENDGRSPIAVSSKHINTIEPADRATYPVNHDPNPDRVAQDAYMLLFKGYGVADKFYAGETLGEAMGKLAAQHKAIDDPFATMQFNDPNTDDCNF